MISLPTLEAHTSEMRGWPKVLHTPMKRTRWGLSETVCGTFWLKIIRSLKHTWWLFEDSAYCWKYRYCESERFPLYFLCFFNWQSVLTRSKHEKYIINQYASKSMESDHRNTIIYVFSSQKMQNQHNQEVRLVPKYFLGLGLVRRRLGNILQAKKRFCEHPATSFSAMSDNQKYADQLWAVKKNWPCRFQKIFEICLK